MIIKDSSKENIQTIKTALLLSLIGIIKKYCRIVWNQFTIPKLIIATKLSWWIITRKIIALN